MVDLNKLGEPGTYEVSEGNLLGGEKRVAYFYDSEGNPTSKEKASRVNIIILDAEGNRIDEVYGFVNA